jgi:hypothetical protein
MPGGVPRIAMSRARATPLAKRARKRMLMAMLAIALLCALVALYAMESTPRGHAQTAALPRAATALRADPRPAATSDAVPLPIPPRTLVSAKPLAKSPPRAMDPPPALPAPAAEVPASVGTSAPPMEPPQQSTPAPAAAPDRWQAMNDALARCEREGGVAAFVCEQRARVDACEGYWGMVAQCARPSDYPR